MCICSEHTTDKSSSTGYILKINALLGSPQSDSSFSAAA